MEFAVRALLASNLSMPKAPALSLTLFSLFGTLYADQRWHQLLQHNPYVAAEAPTPKPPELPPAYEFRGRSVEGNVEHFSLYHIESKKSLWVTRGGTGDLSVKEFDPATGLVLADASGRVMHLALKMPQRSQYSHVASSVAYVANRVPKTPPSIATPVSTSESHRLGLVADQVRARRAQRSLQNSRG